MKLYLDDERETPEGWVRCYWPKELIELLRIHGDEVTHISLDHDLGDDQKGTGYDVLLWIEEQVVYNGYVPPQIYIHTANSSARDKMWRALGQIRKLEVGNG